MDTSTGQAYLQSITSQTFQHLIDALFFGVLPVFLIGILIGAVTNIFAARDGGPTDRAAVLAFAFVGAAAGLMIGASRQPITQAALPALLTFASTFLAYVYVKQKADAAETARIEGLRTMIETEHVDTKRVSGVLQDLLGNVRFIPAGIIALSLASLGGSFYGSSIRDMAEQRDRDYQEWLKAYETVELPLQKEFLRRQAGLPPEPAK